MGWWITTIHPPREFLYLETFEYWERDTGHVILPSANLSLSLVHVLKHCLNINETFEIDVLKNFKRDKLLTWLKSPEANLASASENAASFMTSPMVCFVSTIFFKIILNLNWRASAFFFKRLWPFWAPLSRPFIVVIAPRLGKMAILSFPDILPQDLSPESLLNNESPKTDTLLNKAYKNSFSFFSFRNSRSNQKIMWPITAIYILPNNYSQIYTRSQSLYLKKIQNLNYFEVVFLQF